MISVQSEASDRAAAGSPPASWVEAYGARRRAAIAHLRSVGILVSVVDREAPVPSWRVSGYAGSLSTEQLFWLAEQHGLEA